MRWSISAMATAVELRVLRWLLVRQIQRCGANTIILASEALIDMSEPTPETSSLSPLSRMTSSLEDGSWLRAEMLIDPFSGTGRKSRHRVH
jgi:hypothetical protein